MIGTGLNNTGISEHSFRAEVEQGDGESRVSGFQYSRESLTHNFEETDTCWGLSQVVGTKCTVTTKNEANGT